MDRYTYDNIEAVRHLNNQSDHRKTLLFPGKCFDHMRFDWAYTSG